VCSVKEYEKNRQEGQTWYPVTKFGDFGLAVLIATSPPGKVR
jgi:hypothetical protein